MSRSLQRYYPDVWVRNVHVNVRMAELVNSFLNVAHRKLPNLILECLTENIFTQADSWDELRDNVVDATAAFFFDRPAPGRVRLHLVRDEVLSLA